MFRFLIDRYRFSALQFALLTLALLSCLPAPSRGQGTGKKNPIPTGPALIKAEELIQDLFGKDIEKAKKDPAVGSKVAARLLKEARASKQFLAECYVCYREARDVA